MIIRAVVTLSCSYRSSGIICHCSLVSDHQSTFQKLSSSSQSYLLGEQAIKTMNLFFYHNFLVLRREATSTNYFGSPFVRLRYCVSSLSAYSPSEHLFCKDLPTNFHLRLGRSHRIIIHICLKKYSIFQRNCSHFYSECPRPLIQHFEFMNHDRQNGLRTYLFFLSSITLICQTFVLLSALS